MTIKFAVQDALDIINNELLENHTLFPLDNPDRTKAHSYAVGSESGKQFAIVLGEKGRDGKFSASVRIITEKVYDPKIPNARWSNEPYKGGKISKQQTTSKGHPNNLTGSNQSSFFIDNETAFRDFIRWYSQDLISQPILEEENQHAEINPLASTISNTNTLENNVELTDDLINLVNESIDSTTATQSIQARLGQGKFRKNVIETWGLGECCAVTGTNITPLLIASHIIPWREDVVQRLSGTNGILLCSHLDKLFDQYLIGFDTEGNLISSNRLSDHEWDQLNTIGIHKSLRLNTGNLSIEDAREIAINLNAHQAKLKYNI